MQTGQVGPGGQPPGQPFGFASPDVPSLSLLEPPSRGEDADLVPPPDSYEPPAGPLAPLESIAPTPPEVRDPVEPFVHTLPQALEPAWRPDQPLQLSNATPEIPEVDPSALPPPAGVGPIALPPPTGPPVTALAQGPYPGHPYPGHAYPVNPYATGPYSAPTHYPPPAPYGPPGPTPAPYGPPGPTPPYGPYAGTPGAAGDWGSPRPVGGGAPITPARVWQAADGIVISLLIIGTVWPPTSPYVLLLAAVAAFVRSSQGKVLVAVAALIGTLVWLVWWLGYFATSQWQDATQFLCMVCLIGVPLIAYQSLRRSS